LVLGLSEKNKARESITRLFVPAFTGRRADNA
jgi:hypothetical protein